MEPNDDTTCDALSNLLTIAYRDFPARNARLDQWMRAVRRFDEQDLVAFIDGRRHEFQAKTWRHDGERERREWKLWMPRSLSLINLTLTLPWLPNDVEDAPANDKPELLTSLVSQRDAAPLLAKATAAVGELRVITSRYRHDLDEQERLDARLRSDTARRDAERLTTAALAEIRGDFVALHAHPNPQARGRLFEPLLGRLLDVYDMQPHIAYNVPFEQIDGSFTFDTDAYLLEAKWCKAAIEREQADAFAAKIGRKGRNTLGLFIAVNGFTAGFTGTTHAGGAPFIAMDGDDLFHVLGGRSDSTNSFITRAPRQRHG